MIVREAIFGNPWHGKLAAGSIELIPGSPVTSITIDGVEHTVKSITGNLGDTRYYKPPYLPDDPATPDSVSAMNGTFKRDMVIYSNAFRYSPLTAKSILASAYEWLLWDSTALSWRKMKIEYTWQTLSTNPGAASAQGENLVQIRIYRGDIFGRIDHDMVDTPDGSPSWTLVSSTMLPYRHTYNDVFSSLFGAWLPAGLSLSIDARGDGVRIIVRIYAPRSWNTQGASIYYSPAPDPLLNTTMTCLHDAFEIVFSGNGATVDSITELVASSISIVPKPENLMRTVSDGAPYFVPPESWYVPVTVEFKVDTGPHGVFNSALANAAYDSGGAAHLIAFVATGQQVTTHTESADVYIGFNDGSYVPSYSVGPTAWTVESSWYGLNPREPFSLNYTIGSDSKTESRSFRLIDGATVIHEWTDIFTSAVTFEAITNNVVGLTVGANSIARVGPGVIDYSSASTPVYASFNPRTGVVVSSASPIGFV